MRALRIAGIAVAAIVVLVIGGAAVVASRFDAERIKTELARTVLEKKQRTLKIGALELRFWPRLGVTLGKLSLSEHGNAREFASVDAARLAVAVLPLLSKRVVVDTIEISGARAVVIRHADGTLNIDDLLAKDEAASPPVQVDVAGIKLADAEVTWRDEKSGRSMTVSALDLATGRMLADTDKKTFQVEGLSLTAKAGTGGGDREAPAQSFDIRLAAPRLAVAAGRAGGDLVTLSAAAPGTDAQLTLYGVEATGQALKIDKVVCAVDVKAGSASVKGALTAAVAADLEHQTLALDKLAGDVDIAHPRLPLKQIKLPLSGALHADLAKQTAAGRIAARLDEAKIALDFDAARFAPLALGFDLDIDKLDADKYLPQKKAGAEETKGGDGKLDFAALKGAKLNGTVRIGSLRLAGVTATNVRLQVRADDGKLDIAGLATSAVKAKIAEKERQVKQVENKLRQGLFGK